MTEHRIDPRRTSAQRLLAVAITSLPRLIAAPAWADASCQQLLADKIAVLQSRGGWFSIDMTMHREGVALVTYSQGGLQLGADGSLQGGANQLFNDRYLGSQPFDVNAADGLTLQLDGSGVLTIDYSPWNFQTQWDMSCQGEFVTKYIPGHGIVTLAFRSWYPPIW